jgi:hypothetical protein
MGFNLIGNVTPKNSKGNLYHYKVVYDIGIVLSLRAMNVTNTWQIFKHRKLIDMIRQKRFFNRFFALIFFPSQRRKTCKSKGV